MAPVELALGDRLNLSGMVATWLGTFFTAVGLLAVIQQLRNVIRSNNREVQSFINRAAGKWSLLFDIKEITYKDGLTEQAAPAMIGWIQRKYLTNGTTELTQSDNLTAGTSSWSRFFQQCGIDPSELRKWGGKSGQVWPTGWAEPRTPVQADIRREDGKLMYGFTAAEFAAIVIISGLNPCDFELSGTNTSIHYLGIMHLTDHGPFSQVGHFDPHGGSRVILHRTLRGTQKIPIRGAIHAALGMIELDPPRGERSWIIPPILETQATPNTFNHWSELPSSSHLNDIRYNMEQLVSVSGMCVVGYTAKCKDILQTETQLMREISNTLDPNTHKALVAAYAITALETWSIHATLHKHYINAFEEILEPFVAEGHGIVEELSIRLIKCPTLRNNSGWPSTTEQAERLTQLGNIKTEYFCRSSNYCAYYYRAMEAVFQDENLSLREVRVVLAAMIAWRMIFPSSRPYDTSDTDEKWRSFMLNFTRHLNYDRSVDPFGKDWAVRIYATYLWGWLQGESLITYTTWTRFRRRVFIG